MENLTFRRANKNDVDKIIKLFEERIAWEDEQNINHWNKLGYLNFYKRDYFESHIESFFVAEQNETIVATIAIYLTDEAWEDCDDAIYLHHLVSSPKCKGAGKLMFEFAEKYAKDNGYKKLRLDSATNNDALTKYYAAMGFKIVGTTIQGDYHGYLQEKEI